VFFFGCKQAVLVEMGFSDLGVVILSLLASVGDVAPVVRRRWALVTWYSSHVHLGAVGGHSLLS
jgi:hypothetical protein